MAALFIGVNWGDDLSPDNMTTGTTTTGKDVELSVRSTVQASGITRADVLIMSEAIVRAIVDGRFTTFTM